MIASASSDRVLVDTNLVVYAHDPGDPLKHQRAQELLTDLSDTGRLVYSVQVLNEFCSVMMRARRASPLSPPQAGVIIEDPEATGDVLPLTAETTILALQAMSQRSLSFWDALIWATAKLNSVAVIYTEDFQDGQVVDGVEYENPFRLPA
jgi:predicted nucleic acid-binding protein